MQFLQGAPPLRQVRFAHFYRRAKNVSQRKAFQGALCSKTSFWRLGIYLRSFLCRFTLGSGPVTIAATLDAIDIIFFVVLTGVVVKCTYNYIYFSWSIKYYITSGNPEKTSSSLLQVYRYL